MAEGLRRAARLKGKTTVRSFRAPSDASADALVCSVCLENIGPERGRLNMCEHIFHVPCITEWSKVTNSCPLCKTYFRVIIHEKLDEDGQYMEFHKTRLMDDRRQRVWYDDEDEANLVDMAWAEDEEAPAHSNIDGSDSEGESSDDYDYEDPFINDDENLDDENLPGDDWREQLQRMMSKPADADHNAEGLPRQTGGRGHHNQGNRQQAHQRGHANNNVGGMFADSEYQGRGVAIARAPPVNRAPSLAVHGAHSGQNRGGTSMPRAAAGEWIDMGFKRPNLQSQSQPPSQEAKYGESSRFFGSQQDPIELTETTPVSQRTAARSRHGSQALSCEVVDLVTPPQPHYQARDTNLYDADADDDVLGCEGVVSPLVTASAPTSGTFEPVYPRRRRLVLETARRLTRPFVDVGAMDEALYDDVTKIATDRYMRIKDAPFPTDASGTENAAAFEEQLMDVITKAYGDHSLALTLERSSQCL
eukprot:Opistho-2@84157